MWKFGIFMLVGAATCAGSLVSASAQTAYDGRWSVSIITDKGTCDRGYRYAIFIRNGVLYYKGDVVDINGRVARSGVVSVMLSRGNLSANGQGRLGRDFGQGVWRGAGGSDSCSGRWEAERR